MSTRNSTCFRFNQISYHHHHYHYHQAFSAWRPIKSDNESNIFLFEYLYTLTKLDIFFPIQIINLYNTSGN